MGDPNEAFFNRLALFAHDSQDVINYLKHDDTLATINLDLVDDYIIELFNRYGRVQTLLEEDVKLYLWQRYETRADEIVAQAEVADLLLFGGKLWDCMLWLSLSTPAKKKAALVFDDVPAHHGPATSELTGRSNYFQIMMTLLKGTPSESQNATPGVVVPRFLSAVLDRRTPLEYARYLTNLTITKFPLKWISEIDLSGATEETKNRLKMATAGRRIVTPFSKYYYKTICPPNLHQAAQLAERIAFLPANFDTHPIGATDAYKQLVYPMNQNGGALLVAVFGQANVQMFVREKTIALMPGTTNETKWEGWKPEQLPDIQRWFFPDEAYNPPKLEPTAAAWAAMSPAEQATYPLKQVLPSQIAPIAGLAGLGAPGQMGPPPPPGPQGPPPAPQGPRPGPSSSGQGSGSGPGDSGQGSSGSGPGSSGTPPVPFGVSAVQAPASPRQASTLAPTPQSIKTRATSLAPGAMENSKDILAVKRSASMVGLGGQASTSKATKTTFNYTEGKTTYTFPSDPATLSGKDVYTYLAGELGDVTTWTAKGLRASNLARIYGNEGIEIGVKVAQHLISKGRTYFTTNVAE